MAIQDASTAADIVSEVASPPLLDEPSFHRLYAHAARPLWSYLYRVVGNATQADDLVQEAFMKLLKAPVGSLAPDGQRAYLFRLAGNLAIDAWRARKREADARPALEPDVPGPPERERDLDLARTFGQLTPQERAMLWMAYVEGSAHEEIAGVLHVKPASVKVLLFRARRKLRNLLGRSVPGESR
jgi:RNA polymerase sigma-70 factor (ECF subfamily)